MAGIYGPIVEHPEFPIEDINRFTVTIVPHPMNNGIRLTELEQFAYGDCCTLCFFPANSPHHGEDFPVFVDPRR